jgi:hypothetical protein
MEYLLTWMVNEQEGYTSIDVYKGFPERGVWMSKNADNCIIA